MFHVEQKRAKCKKIVENRAPFRFEPLDLEKMLLACPNENVPRGTFRERVRIA